jgi:hypothetical protein
MTGVAALQGRLQPPFLLAAQRSAKREEVGLVAVARPRDL